MTKIKITNTSIDGLVIIEPKVFRDNRGYFTETYNSSEFAECGIDAVFVQDNQSHSSRGVLRGLHFQKNSPQGKLVRVISGTVLDVAVDLRASSKTFGKWESVILSGENMLQFYIPEGFAHGFVVLSDEATFTYKCTRLYDPTDEGGILWNDPELNIDWHLDGIDEVILSEKDKIRPTLRESGFRFENL
ncbi:MAG: dTDP-4-dehydrorhamnose 3,5-epimerase [Oscillospiraceae bacterium]